MFLNSNINETQNKNNVVRLRLKIPYNPRLLKQRVDIITVVNNKRKKKKKSGVW